MPAALNENLLIVTPLPQWGLTPDWRYDIMNEAWCRYIQSRSPTLSSLLTGMMWVASSGTKDQSQSVEEVGRRGTFSLLYRHDDAHTDYGGSGRQVLPEEESGLACLPYVVQSSMAL